MRNLSFASLGVAVLLIALWPGHALGARRLTPNPQQSPIAAVLQVQVIPVERAAQMVRALYPHAHIRVDQHANALVVVAPQAELDAMRTIVQGIDVKNPTQPAIDIIMLKTITPQILAARLRPLFPGQRPDVQEELYVGPQQRICIFGSDGVQPKAAIANGAQGQTWECGYRRKRKTCAYTWRFRCQRGAFFRQERRNPNQQHLCANRVSTSVCRFEKISERQAMGYTAAQGRQISEPLP